MKTGKIYRRFKATSGETVTLRALRWEDLDSCVVFVNDLVGEKKTEPNLGVMVDTRQTGEGEAEWLTNQLTGIEKGNIGWSAILLLLPRFRSEEHTSEL